MNAAKQIVSGADGGTGVGLVEVFEAEGTNISELSNISTRGFVQTGDNVMIGGVIIEGGSPATVLIRARGPSMSERRFLCPELCRIRSWSSFQVRMSLPRMITGRTNPTVRALIVPELHR